MRCLGGAVLRGCEEQGLHAARGVHGGLAPQTLHSDLTRISRRRHRDAATIERERPPRGSTGDVAAAILLKGGRDGQQPRLGAGGESRGRNRGIRGMRALGSVIAALGLTCRRGDPEGCFS